VYFGPNLVGPLYAGIAEQDRAKRVIDTLENEGFGLADEAITPTQLRSARLRVLRTEILAGSGLAQHRLVLDARAASTWLPGSRKASAKTIIELCKNEGFHEYFDPFTGKGLGSTLFSWSAALLLDVLMEDGE
jgi:hypothetical protein